MEPRAADGCGRGDPKVERSNGETRPAVAGVAGPCQVLNMMLIACQSSAVLVQRIARVVLLSVFKFVRSSRVGARRNELDATDASAHAVGAEAIPGSRSRARCFLWRLKDAKGLRVEHAERAQATRAAPPCTHSRQAHHVRRSSVGVAAARSAGSARELREERVSRLGARVRHSRSAAAHHHGPRGARLHQHRGPAARLGPAVRAHSAAAGRRTPQRPCLACARGRPLWCGCVALRPLHPLRHARSVSPPAPLCCLSLLLWHAGPGDSRDLMHGLAALGLAFQPTAPAAAATATPPPVPSASDAPPAPSDAAAPPHDAAMASAAIPNLAAVPPTRVLVLALRGLAAPERQVAAALLGCAGLLDTWPQVRSHWLLARAALPRSNEARHGLDCFKSVLGAASACRRRSRC